MRVEWFCKRCITGTRRYRGTERCVSCECYLKVYGLKWCQKCGKTYSKKFFKKSFCDNCRSAANAAWYVRTRKRTPPEGYVPLRSVDLGYSTASVFRLIRSGWLKELLWRNGRQGHLWIKKLDKYPSSAPYRQRAPWKPHATTISKEK